MIREKQLSCPYNMGRYICFCFPDYYLCCDCKEREMITVCAAVGAMVFAAGVIVYIVLKY